MTPVGRASGMDTLRSHYHNRHAAALNAHRSGQLVVGVTSTTVPFELIASTGMYPLLLCPGTQTAGSRPTESGGQALPPAHEVYMEEVFDGRMRLLFDFLTSGAGDFLKSVIVPRTSEQDHKLFLYLQEFQRQTSTTRIPDVYLFNLLHTQFDLSRSYSLERTRGLRSYLESLACQGTDADSLMRSLAAGNAARDASRQLVRLREMPAPRLSGSDALALLGARYFMEPTNYAELALRAAQEVEHSPHLTGPRILIKGYPLDHFGLHRQIESHGAVVFAEDDPRGSRSATPNIASAGDPLEAICEHYFSQVTSPRVFPAKYADQWFHEKALLADGVVFYLPPDDDIHGWDYPRHTVYLQQRGIPHLLVRADAAEFLIADEYRSPAAITAGREIENFVAQLNSWHKV